LWNNSAVLSWVELHSDRFRSNIDAFRRLAGAETSLMVVVKANAYGHGLPALGPIAAQAGDWFGVNAIDEAVTLRRLGVQQPIAVLGHTESEHTETIVREDLRQVVYRLEIAQELAAAGERLGRPARIHLKIETGTNRQGIGLDELEAFARQLGNL